MMRSVLLLGVCLVVRFLATLGDAHQNQSCSAITGHVSEILANLSWGIDANSTEVVREGVCSLQSNCCPGRTEALISTAVTVKYQTRIRGIIYNQTRQCYNSTIYDLLSNFIGANKALVIYDLKSQYGPSFTPYLMLFDTFYGYLQQTMYTRNICQLRDQFYQLFFNLYMAAYRAAAQVSIPPDTPQFRNCSYYYFLQTQGPSIQSYYTIFNRPFEMLMQYLRALKTGDAVLESLWASSTFSRGCNVSLAKMVACSYCAGYGGGAEPCQGMCLNVFRGCLVDLAGLAAPLGNFVNILVTFSRVLQTDYSPWDQVTLLEIKFFSLINTVRGQWSTINQQLTVLCSGSSGKRSVFHHTVGSSFLPAVGSSFLPAVGSSFHPITRRSTAQGRTLISAVNSSASCFLPLPSLLAMLPEATCSSLQAVPTNQQCWNGRNIGGYDRNLTQPGLPSQLSNPEVLVCPWGGRRYSSQIQLLTMVTGYMKVKLGLCSPDDEDCTIPVTSCDLQYALPHVSVTTAAAPQDGVIDDSGSGDGSGDYGRECVMPTTVSIVTPTIELSTAPTATSEPPPPSTLEPCTGLDAEDIVDSALATPPCTALLTLLCIATVLFSVI
eukprot:Em0021g134a